MTRETFDPQPGDGVTYIPWTDNYPATVIRRTPKTVTVQFDKAIRTDDRGPFTEAQEYRFEPDPGGRKLTFTLRADGSWRATGSRSGSRLVPGRRAYRDPCF